MNLWDHMLILASWLSNNKDSPFLFVFDLFTMSLGYTIINVEIYILIRGSPYVAWYEKNYILSV